MSIGTKYPTFIYFNPDDKPALNTGSAHAGSPQQSSDWMNKVISQDGSIQNSFTLILEISLLTSAWHMQGVHSRVRSVWIG